MLKFIQLTRQNQLSYIFNHNDKARSFVVIMIIIAVFALLLRIAIEQIIKINIEQNESNAQTTLKLISTALENYANDHNGIFPLALSILTDAKLADAKARYLDEDYITQSPVRGYNYGCSKIEASGYNCAASPVKCGLTGNTVYTIATGGLLLVEDCLKREKE